MCRFPSGSRDQTFTCGSNGEWQNADMCYRKYNFELDNCMYLDIIPVELVVRTQLTMLHLSDVGGTYMYNHVVLLTAWLALCLL